MVRTRRTRRDRGAAAVEFALVMPILVLLVFGLIQYGLYFWAYQGGSDITRSAARLSAVSNPLTCEDFRAAIRSQIDDLNGRGTSATITRDYSTADDDFVMEGDTVIVHVEFTSADLNMPFLPFVNDGIVSATAQARVDFVDDGQPEEC